MPISVAQAKLAHDFDNLMEAPSIKHGMNRYKEMKEEGGEKTEVATSSSS